MKRTIRYHVNEKEVEREYNHIPFRYILAILITVFEVAAIIGIVLAFCYYVPYFYVLCWITEIACVIKIIASDDNPDYKIPWLLLVMILPVAAFQAKMLCNIAEAHLFTGTKQTYFPLGEDMHPQLLADLSKAEKKC